MYCTYIQLNYGFILLEFEKLALLKTKAVHNRNGHNKIKDMY